MDVKIYLLKEKQGDRQAIVWCNYNLEAITCEFIPADAKDTSNYADSSLLPQDKYSIEDRYVPGISPDTIKVKYLNKTYLLQKYYAQSIS